MTRAKYSPTGFGFVRVNGTVIPVEEFEEYSNEPSNGLGVDGHLWPLWRVCDGSGLTSEALVDGFDWTDSAAFREKPYGLEPGEPSGDLTGRYTYLPFELDGTEEPPDEPRETNEACYLEL